MSPTLFLIMFDDLMKTLKENGINAFAYADDLAIIGKCKANLLNAINIIEEWAERNKLIINKKKSGIMYENMCQLRNKLGLCYII